MKKIFKYPLQVIDSQYIMMPEGYEILHIDWQGSQLCMWALVDDMAQESGVLIEIHGTGNPVPYEVTGEKYITTVQDGGLHMPFVTPIKIPATTDVIMSVVSDAVNADAVCQANIRGWIET